HRSTSGQDVLGGVNVPVVPDAAGRARPVPSGKAQLGEQVPARRARLARGVPPVDHDQAAAVLRCLVLQLAAELPPTGVEDRARQVPVADHATHVEVFDHDHVVVADQPGCGLVQEVRTRLADFGVCAGDLHPGFGPVVRPALFAGHAPLVAGQVPGLALQVARVRDLLAGGQDREVLHPEVDTDRSPGRGKRLRVVDVNGDGGVPATIRVAGD